MKFVKNIGMGSAMYPGAKPFIKDWYHSVREQSDADFELCLALDGITPAEVEKIVGGKIAANWIQVEEGRSPAGVRQRLLEYMTARYDGIVLVDSDDILHPQRVEAARRHLLSGDLNGCALNMVDSQGENLEKKLTLPPESAGEDVFPRYNIYGLSNTAWRSTLLQKCLPIPEEVELVDWYLATRAWLLNASMTFDPAPRMDYRQYDANSVTTCPPFSREQIIHDTQRVLDHFHFIRKTPLAGGTTERWQKLTAVAEDVEQFSDHVLSSQERFNSYLESLNTLDVQPLWWVSVAHPKLQYLWS